MLTTGVRIVIPGDPAPKGSMKCVGQKGRHQLVEDNPATKEWRTLLAYWIRRKWPDDQHAGKHQPLGVDVTFVVPRPPGHYGTGRNAGIVKASAPIHPATQAAGSGDVDKLLRLVLDAVQDTDVLPNDAQVVEALARKRYPRETDDPPDPDHLAYPGVVIRLYPIPLTD